MVYREVLVAPSDIFITLGTKDAPWTREWAAPALLQVCRLLRDEAASIYFSENTFDFCDARTLDIKNPQFSRWPLTAWLVLIGHKYRSLLRTIFLGDDRVELEEVDARLEACKAHLQEKGLTIPQAEISLPLNTHHSIPEDCDTDCDIRATSATRVTLVECWGSKEEHAEFRP